MSHQVYSHTLPSATPGTQRVVKAHHFGELGSRPKIYLQAGLHADEWPGFLVLNTLIKKLIKADEKGLIKGEIIIVPVANPIGLGQNFHGYIPGRFAFSDGGEISTVIGPNWVTRWSVEFTSKSPVILIKTLI